jgi:hypothetical protein
MNARNGEGGKTGWRRKGRKVAFVTICSDQHPAAAGQDVLHRGTFQHSHGVEWTEKLRETQNISPLTA